jgi:hypothetical protein
MVSELRIDPGHWPYRLLATLKNLQSFSDLRVILTTSGPWPFITQVYMKEGIIPLHIRRTETLQIKICKCKCNNNNKILRGYEILFRLQKLEEIRKKKEEIKKIKKERVS